MSIVIVILLNLVMWVVGTAVLTGALMMTGEEITKEVVLKCLGIGLLATVASYIPIFGFLSGIVWLVAIMVVFEKTFVEAVIIAIACWIINIVVGFGLALLI